MNLMFDLMMEKDEKSVDHQRYYSLSRGAPQQLLRLIRNHRSRPPGGARTKVGGSAEF